ncbi:MAG: YihY/virulence factor BrkB family protein [Muribaculaceae bacterium]|nr:YihY/virulence factor BrkB family protein [Muribaculaceae bacterium]
MTTKKPNIADRIARLKEWALAKWDYLYMGVWRDTRRNWKVDLIKTLNLSARSFMSSDLQTQACAMTYRTLLAIVPALALIFAIARGFGFQNLIDNQLHDLLPSQSHALDAAMHFVDSYLAQASEGIFVGIGIVFLLWTLISLLGNVEDSLNKIWRVPKGRSLWRKVTDYLAIFLILPVLMICAGGISLLMSTTLKTLLPFDFMGPAITFVIDILGLVLTWLFFAGAYMLIPNAKVKFVNAFLAGALVGSAFQVLQWLFLTGQMYVTKYNAIYGSFSFLPLLLIWLQLVWLITLIGGVLCYASQNIGQFNFGDDVRAISLRYRREVAIAVMAIITKRFARHMPPATVSHISKVYGLPVSLLTELVRELRDVGLINFIEAPGELQEHPLQPAIEVNEITIGKVVDKLQNRGESDFIPNFERDFGSVSRISNEITEAMVDRANSIALISLDIDIPDDGEQTDNTKTLLQ